MLQVIKNNLGVGGGVGGKRMRGERDKHTK